MKNADKISSTTKRAVILTAVLWGLFIIAVSISLILAPTSVSQSRSVVPTSKIRFVSREDFSIADHYARACEFVEKRYMIGNKYDDYNVYPLFDQNDDFTYCFVVDFEPAGFVFINVSEGDFLAVGMLGMSKYKPCYTTNSWYQWRYPTNDAPAYNLTWHQNTEKGNYYVVDEGGDVIMHEDSPFKVASVEDYEMRYMLECEDNNFYVLAVKRGEEFFNVVSCDTFQYGENFMQEKHVSFFVGVDA